MKIFGNILIGLGVDYTPAVRNAASTSSADRAAIAVVRRETVAAMRAGRRLHHSHKEGGSFTTRSLRP